MGFFVLVFVVCVIIFMVFIFMGNADHERVQKEIAVNMYGGMPVVTSGLNDKPVIDVEKECARIEALIQAREAGHDDVHHQIEDGTYTGPWPERRSDGAWTSIFDDLRILSIAGINHRQGIVRYKGRNMAALVPEPGNEFDPNAIKIVHEGNIHVGYIPADSTDFVRSIVKLPAFAFGEIVESEDYSDEQPRAFFYGKVYLELKQKQPTSNGQLSKITV